MGSDPNGSREASRCLVAGLGNFLRTAQISKQKLMLLLWPRLLNRVARNSLSICGSQISHIWHPRSFEEGNQRRGLGSGKMTDSFPAAQEARGPPRPRCKLRATPPKQMIGVVQKESRIRFIYRWSELPQCTSYYMDTTLRIRETQEPVPTTSAT